MTILERIAVARLAILGLAENYPVVRVELHAIAAALAEAIAEQPRGGIGFGLLRTGLAVSDDSGELD